MNSIKKIIKTLISLIFLIINIPLFLIWKIIFLSSPKAFTTISELISLFPGYFGYFIRNSFYKMTGNIGNNVEIKFGTILEFPTVRIRDNNYIGQNCTLAPVTINKGCKIGSNVDIISGGKTHRIGKDKKILATNPKDFKRIIIGKNTWIGNSAVIMNDIGDNCIIGAGSVVVKPIPSNSVAVGNPAKVIRKR
jgi:virginiamycin A acetyltransferase